MEEHMLRRAQQSGGSKTFQNVPNQQCRDFHPTWKFRAGTIPRLPAGRWCWWPTMVLVGKLRSTSSIHNDGAATAFWRQSPKPCWEHARSTLRHTAQTEEKVGQGCSPSRGKLGRGATSAPCPLEIRQSFHTVLINWVGQEQYRFSLSLVSKIQGYNV